MEHVAMVRVINQLILSGMREPDAIQLVTQLLFEEAEDFITVVDEVCKSANPQTMN